MSNWKRKEGITYKIIKNDFITKKAFGTTLNELESVMPLILFTTIKKLPNDSYVIYTLSANDINSEEFKAIVDHKLGLVKAGAFNKSIGIEDYIKADKFVHNKKLLIKILDEYKSGLEIGKYSSTYDKIYNLEERINILKN